MSREKALAKNTLIISFGTFLPQLTTLITLPILTAYLTKAEYGSYDFINTLVALILPIATLKIEAAAFRFLIDCREDNEKTKEIVSTIYAFLIPVSVLVIVVLFILNNDKMEIQTRSLVSAYFLLNILTSATQQIVRGLSKNMLYSISTILSSIINMLLIVLTVYWRGQGLNGVLFSTIIATFVALIVLFVFTGLFRLLSISAFSKKKLKEMLAYSWPMVPNSLSLWIMNLSDRLIIVGVLGLEATAIYAVANKIPSLFGILQGTFVLAWQENASISVKDNDSEEYYSSIFDSIYTLLVGAMAVLITITPVLFNLLINKQYASAYYQMPLLFGGIFFSTVSSFLGGIYVAHRKTASIGITTMLAAISNLLINLILIKFIGLYAASLSTFMSYLFLTMYRMSNVQKFQRIHFKFKKMTIYLIILILLAGICYLNQTYLNIVNLLLGGGFAIFICRKMLLALVTSLNNRFIDRR